MYTQEQIERAARVIVAFFEDFSWEAMPASAQAEYIDLATEVARELDGGI